MRDTLEIETFMKLKNLVILNDKIDIINDNLLSNFITDGLIKVDNANLWGTSKDLFKELITL